MAKQKQINKKAIKVWGKQTRSIKNGISLYSTAVKLGKLFLPNILKKKLIEIQRHDWFSEFSASLYKGRLS